MKKQFCSPLVLAVFLLGLVPRIDSGANFLPDLLMTSQANAAMLDFVKHSAVDSTQDSLHASIVVTSPNGGERWFAGETRTIEWTADDGFDHVQISYSLDGGETWNFISDVLAPPYSYQWQLPEISSASCAIKVTSLTNPEVSDQSDSLFSIGEPSISVLSPNGGELWVLGSQQTIRWESEYLSGYVRVEYSADNGNSWTIIVDNIQDSGELVWNVPGETSFDNLIRISDVDSASITDQSNSSFIIDISDEQRFLGVANSMLQQIPNPESYDIMDWRFVNALYGILRAYQYSGDIQYIDYIRQWADAHIDPNGNFDRSIIDTFTAGLLLEVYFITGENRYYQAGLKTRDYYDSEFTRLGNGVLVHTNDDQVWVDTLFGVIRFLLPLAKALNDNSLLDEAADQIILHTEILQDPETKLFYHGWDEDGSAAWADPVTHHSPEFWGRGDGWVIASLVDILEVLPVTNPKRDRLIEILQEFGQALVDDQDTETGVWRTLLNKPQDPQNYLETSATSLFVYGLQKGLSMGLLPADLQAMVDNADLGLSRLGHEVKNDIHYVINISEGTNVGGTEYYYGRKVGNGFEYTYGLGVFLEAKYACIIAPSYELPWANLDVMVIGGGQVTLDPPGGFYNDGTLVKINAVPAEGWKFTGWTGDLSGSSQSDSVSTDQDLTISTTFEEIQPEIWSFTPPEGNIGTQVTISGKDFTGVTDVSFNGVPSQTFSIESDSVIKAFVPVLATSGSISLTNPWRSAWSNGDFNVPFDLEPESGLWISPDRIATLPTSGPAWDELLAVANSDAGSPQLRDKDDDTNVKILAKALVYARIGGVEYRDKVVRAIKKVTLDNTEDGGNTLALGRELAAYIIAADIINLAEIDPDLNQQFKEKLRELLTKVIKGWGSPNKTLVETHEQRANNWGTHAGASRAAIAVYLGDTAELERTAHVFKGWLGDRDAYSDFDYGNDLSWQCDPDNPVGINPVGCEKEGHSIDGALPEEMRRGDEFQWPPTETNYTWEGLQGAIVLAEILHRAGYPAWEWQDQALLRAGKFLERIGWYAVNDDEWQPWLINFAYVSDLQTVTPTRPGKNLGWTDWTHHSSRLAPPVINSFSPEIGQVGAEITLSGSEFREISAIRFNDTNTTEFVISSDSLIVVVVPEGAASGPIMITNLAGSDTSGSDFKVASQFEVLSPNGGEKWHAGDRESITWSSNGSSPLVNIELSLDNGTTWTMLGDSLDNTGEFIWTVMDTLADSSLVRVSDPVYGLSSDVSDSVFAIDQPRLSVKTPNGGERWYQEHRYTISWRTDGRIDSVYLEYSADGGREWQPVTDSIENTGEFVWTLPNINLDSAMVRVVSTLDSSKFDVSDSVFTIASPFISVVIPDGGESWITGSEQSIRWMSAGPFQSLDLLLSLDNGATWDLIAEDVEDSGEFLWTIPDTLSDSALVQIRDGMNPEYSDASDGIFSIQRPPFTLLSPNGDEQWEEGSPNTIRWETGMQIDSVSLDYSMDNGREWKSITTVVNQGYFDWQVPFETSDSCLVRVSDAGDSTRFDISDSTFVLLASNNELISPNGGESYVANQNVTVTWNPTGAIGKVDLQLSLNNGSTWLDIALGQPNTGSYDWEVNDRASDFCLIRIIDSDDPESVTTSQNPFSITIPISAGRAIRFDGNDDFMVIPDNALLSGGPGKSMTIEMWAKLDRVEGDHPLAIKFLDANYKDWGIKVQDGVVEVAIENNGNDWGISGGLLEAGKWTHLAFAFSNQSDTVSLFVNGVRVVEKRLEDEMPDSNAPIYFGKHSYSDDFYEGMLDEVRIWNYARDPEQIASGHQRRIFGNEPGLIAYWNFDEDAGQVVSDLSGHGNHGQLGALNTEGPDDPIYSEPGVSLDSPDYLQIVSPVKGDTLTQAMNWLIRWNDNGSMPAVRLEFSLNGGESWQVVNSTLDNNGEYLWQVPDTTTNRGLIRVSDALDMNPLAVSDTFSIVAPSIALLSPNGGEVWYGGQDKLIRWSSNGIPEPVNIQLSSDGGANWQEIAGVENLGEYNWNVPKIFSDSNLVRISSSSRPGLADTSDANFSIKRPEISVVSPNGGEEWAAGSNQEIQWSNVGPIENVDLALSIDNGATWLEIANGLANSGKHEWQVIQELTDSALVRVWDASDNSIADLGDEFFAITGVKDSLEIIINSDDSYDLWVNGENLGSDDQWNVAQTYVAPAPLGTNVLAIEGRNRGNVAGLIAEVRVNGLLVLKTDTSWRYSKDYRDDWIQPDFSESGWKQVNDLGPYGANPWLKRIEGFPQDSPARWVWGEGNLVYYRASFEMPAGGENSSGKHNSELTQVPIPTSYSLYQNYPNPFNPSTEIRFDVPQESWVAVEVFDLLGRRIRVLIDQQMTAGEHSVVWNGRNRFGDSVTGGIYLVRMQSVGFNRTVKALLLK